MPEPQRVCPFRGIATFSNSSFSRNLLPAAKGLSLSRYCNPGVPLPGQLFSSCRKGFVPFAVLQHLVQHTAVLGTFVGRKGFVPFAVLQRTRIFPSDSLQPIAAKGLSLSRYCNFSQLGWRLSSSEMAAKGLSLSRYCNSILASTALAVKYLPQRVCPFRGIATLASAACIR